jgi:hypothetical protein
VRKISSAMTGLAILFCTQFLAIQSVRILNSFFTWSGNQFAAVLQYWRTRFFIQASLPFSCLPWPTSPGYLLCNPGTLTKCAYWANGTWSLQKAGSVFVVKLSLVRVWASKSLPQCWPQNIYRLVLWEGKLVFEPEPFTVGCSSWDLWSC